MCRLFIAFHFSSIRSIFRISTHFNSCNNKHGWPQTSGKKTISWFQKQQCATGVLCECECDCMSATRNNIPFMTNKLEPTDSQTCSGHGALETPYQVKRAACRALTLDLCPMASAVRINWAKWKFILYVPFSVTSHKLYVSMNVRPNEILCHINFELRWRRVVDCANLCWNIDKTFPIISSQNAIESIIIYVTYWLYYYCSLSHSYLAFCGY